MLRITDYSFLFQSLSGNTQTNRVNNIQMSQIGSKSVRTQLKAAGIDTNSKQYKAAIKNMQKGSNGMMFTNVNAIKNQMKQYDSNGDWIDPDTGMTGLLVTEENKNSYKHMISIPESSRDEMFELAKKEFIQGNGMVDGDTTKRSDIYTKMQRMMNKNDRLSATWTLEQYESKYRKAFVQAAKAADPKWDYGKPIPAGALDGIKRIDIDRTLSTYDVKI